MSEFRKDYSIAIAILAEALVLALLLSTPGMIMAEGVNLLDTSKGISTNSGIFVRTKMDFGSQAHLDAFPRQIGEWEAVGDYQVETLKKPWPYGLGAKTAIFRPYSTAGLYTTVDFLAMLSENVSSFHPPEICYAGQGWYDEYGNGGVLSSTLKSTIEYITIENATFVSGPLYHTDGQAQNISIPMGKLVIEKRNETGSVIARQIVLYFYVKDSKLTVQKSITMLRYSTYYGNYGIVDPEVALSVLKEFASKTVPEVFEFKAAERPIGAILVQNNGFWGALLVAAMVMAPIAFVAYGPLVRKIRTTIGK
ncbi:MAG: hypothetical protein PHH26_06645 [Candidatus Thermoplasmatota archaeon]|nr:hypothetical protein [Candidatus Thermoplasmatota archaeon]